jgi:hypothetical protein
MCPALGTAGGRRRSRTPRSRAYHSACPYSGVAVIFEAKVLSDVSTHVRFDLTRNQLARTIDVMLEEEPRPHRADAVAAPGVDLPVAPGPGAPRSPGPPAVPLADYETLIALLLIPVVLADRPIAALHSRRPSPAPTTGPTSTQTGETSPGIIPRSGQPVAGQRRVPPASTAVSPCWPAMMTRATTAGLE